MIKHIVLWKVKETAEGKTGAENARIIKEMLEALKGKVEGIRALEVGLNVKPSGEAADVALYSEFDTLEDLERYAKHPEHLKVVEFVGKVRSERRVIDYEV